MIATQAMNPYPMDKKSDLYKMSTHESAITQLNVPQGSKMQQSSSSRILFDTPCKVCEDHSSGKHYGIFACDGCAGFFKRSIRENRHYVCKAKSEGGGCMVDKAHRNQCRACRLAKCIQAGMNKDAVQHERGPRNSTIRRQMALFGKEPVHEIMTSMGPQVATALDLAMSKPMGDPMSSLSQVPPMVSHYCPSLQLKGAIGLGQLSGMMLGNIANINSLGNVGMANAYVKPNQTPDMLCEQAARLLFFNVHCAKQLATGAGVCMEDQLVLMESSWRELFILATAQFFPQLDPTPILATLSHSQHVNLSQEVDRFRGIVANFDAMKLNPDDYNCLRSVVFFKSGMETEVMYSGSESGSPVPEGQRLRNFTKIRELKEWSQITLSHHLSKVPFGSLRLGNILLLLPSLRTVDPHAIEELFFRKTIGTIAIEKIICDMYRNV